MDKNVISAQDLAEILGISRQTIYNKIDDLEDWDDERVKSYADDLVAESRQAKKDIMSRLKDYNKSIGYNDIRTYTITPADEARFMKKVSKTPTCWLWVAGQSAHGYGQFRFRHKQMEAHRFSYWMRNEYPNGVVRHTCNVKACVNPDHLELGTQQDNMDDLKESREASGHEYKTSKKRRQAVNDRYNKLGK